MPWIEQSSYRPPLLFSNGHLQTLYPYFFRKIKDLEYKRVRLDTHCGDFLDVDLSLVGSEELLIISHGLEGSSDSQYIKGMARLFNKDGKDVLAWNMRSCSGELNRLPGFYHAGMTDDLDLMIQYGVSQGYKKISLMGFSLGANLTSLYLGQRADELAPQITNAVVFSAPCDLGKSAEKISRVKYRFYLESFLITMRQKIIEKSKTMDLGVDLSGIEKIKSFKEFDDRFTGPLHGFKNGQQYYDDVSCKKWLHKIKVPTLIINAKDDPFLTKECFPIQEARENKNLYLEIPKSGGHVGFVSFNSEQLYWSEKRAHDFLVMTG
tara:strand:- start:10763 stop:11728 length:966 start_codon:yes stop_codon:yes gene_type:complete